VKIAISEISTTEKELDVTLTQDEVTALQDSKVEKYRKQIRMPGFRSNKKLPKKLVMMRFGDAIRQEALEQAIDDGLKKELDEQKIAPISYGEMRDFADDKENDISFKVNIEVEPEVEITGYEDLGISVESVEADVAEVDKTLEDMRRNMAAQTEVERESQTGDVLVGEYISFSLDGEEETLPENKEFSAEIGKSASPGFDDGLVGLKAGEEKEISFSYPEDHPQEELRGKEAKFNITVKAVKEMTLPELDDEFAQKMGAESLEQLKSDLQENLQKQKENEKKGEAHEKAIDALIEANSFAVPDARVRHYVHHIVNRYAQEDQKRNPTEEEVEENREKAVRELRKIRIVEYIADKEKIKVRQSAVDERIREMAAMYGMDFDTLKSSMRQSGGVVNLREELKIEKTLDYLIGLRDED
jgi:trigger factor